jgi:hypothetical protein
MKKLSMIVVLLLVALSITFSQSLKYGYDGPFPDTTKAKLPFGILNNAIGVDPAGKVWVSAYDRSTGWNVTADSIDTGGGVYARVGPVFVYNANSTPASFSPIKILSVGGVTDTLRGTSNIAGRLAYGGTINPKTGNYVGVWGNLTYKPGMLLWEINYKTGAGVTRVLNPAGITNNSPASVAVDRDGEYFLVGVLSGIPGMILNPDGSAGTQYAAGVDQIGRGIAVSLDGNDIYCIRFASPISYIFHSDNGSLGPYVKKDSILLGVSVECAAIHPKTGYLWFSCDRRTTALGWNANTYYAWNPATKAIVDSFQVKAWDQSGTGPLPRGIAFSPTGDTVYVAHFDVPTVPAIARFIKNKAVSVERVNDAIPTDYTLSQNYPNPFNPSTQIRFTITQPGTTTLRVYDVMGREVATLVNEHLNSGAYTTTFDASHLSSGTYMYVLTSGTVRLTNKMVLMK